MTDPKPPEHSTPREHPERTDELTPEQMLALVTDQQRSIESKMGSFVPLIVFTWAVAWIAGFGALWLVDGLGEAFSLPFPVAVVILVLVLGVAAALSAVLGIRSARGLRGGKEGAFTGIVYGNTWWLGIIAILALGRALVVNGMATDLLAVFYPAAFLLFMGIMHVLAGAIWHAGPMLALGTWTVVVAVIGAFVGYPTHYLVYAVAGGGGLLLTALWTLLWIRRTRRPLPDGAAS